MKSITTQTTNNDYTMAMIAALVIHIVVLMFMFLSFEWSKTVNPAAKNLGSETAPIQAVAVNSKVVAKQVQQLEEQQAEATAAKENQQRALAAEAKHARLARLHEEQKLQALKQQQEKMQEQQATAQKLLQQKTLQMQQQQLQEQAKLSKLQKQRHQMEVAQQKKAADLPKTADQKKTTTVAKATANDSKAAKTKTTKATAQKKSLVNKQEIKKELKKEVDEDLAADDATQGSDHPDPNANIVQQYVAQIQSAVEQNWNKPSSADPNLQCVLLLKLDAKGSVLSASVFKSSGDPALDQSAITAVYKSQPLPVPADADIFEKFFKEFTITA